MPAPEYLHVVTVGTSLLGNAGWKKGQRLPAKQALLDLLTADPRKHSAELNALVPFIERAQCQHVHLLATDTPDGRLCRDAIGQYLHNRHIATNQGDAAGLLPHALGRASDQDSFHRAACQFRDAVFRVADKARNRGRTVLINATGGLKAETAVATLVAAERGLGAYYIHESMTEPVFLPTAPLDPAILESLHALHQAKSRPPRLSADLLNRLQREGLVKISRRADGQASSIRLTAYGKSLLRKPPGR